MIVASHGDAAPLFTRAVARVSQKPTPFEHSIVADILPSGLSPVRVANGRLVA